MLATISSSPYTSRRFWRAFNAIDSLSGSKSAGIDPNTFSQSHNDSDRLNKICTPGTSRQSCSDKGLHTFWTSLWLCIDETCTAPARSPCAQHEASTGALTRARHCAESRQARQASHHTRWYLLHIPKHANDGRHTRAPFPRLKPWCDRLQQSETLIELSFRHVRSLAKHATL